MCAPASEQIEAKRRAASSGSGPVSDRFLGVVAVFGFLFALGLGFRLDNLELGPDSAAER